jgi:hypothetical protein
VTANFDTIEIPVIDIDDIDDVEKIVDRARKNGIITRQQRADWIKAVLGKKEKMLCMKGLAGILKVSYNKIQKDWKRGNIPDSLKKGKENSRCPVDISKQGAIDYILNFDGTDDFEDPRQRKLPFPAVK